MLYIFLIASLVILVFSAVAHEYAHGAMADYLGDPTAKMAGRLTLNPIAHLDPLGSVLVPLLLVFSGARIFFAWAKPVPFNPYLLRDKVYGPAKVALAGPITNLLLAVVFGLVLRFWPYQGSTFLFNLSQFFDAVVWVNLSLAVFNLVPIPPLDGSHILFAFFPKAWESIHRALAQYGSILLVVFILFFPRLLLPIISFLYLLIVGVPIL